MEALANAEKYLEMTRNSPCKVSILILNKTVKQDKI